MVCVSRPRGNGRCRCVIRNRVKYQSDIRREIILVRILESHLKEGKNPAECSLCSTYKTFFSGVEKFRSMWARLYLSALVLYLPLIVLRLTNDMDGMWDQDDHVTGVAELRMGRWFWPMLDKLRLNISLDPLPAVLALAIFSCGILFLFSILRADLTDKRGKVTAWLAGMMILVSPSLLCQLSYSHMSINDAVSFFCAILAVWLLQREKCRKKDMALSAMFVALMMGGYQASLGITCVTALLCFLLLLEQEEEIKKALSFAGKILFSLAVGAVLYEVFLHLCLFATGETLADYNGADAITFSGVIGNLPSSLRHTYTSFQFYFGGAGYQFHVLQGHRWFLVLYFVLAIAVVWYIGRTLRDKKQKRLLRSILMVAAFLLLPVFANSFFLLAVSAETMMQMTMGMALVLPGVLLLLMNSAKVYTKKPNEADGLSKEETLEKKGTIRSFCFWPVLLAVSAFLLYGEIGQTATDQYAMYMGRRASMTLAECALDQFAASGIDYTENVVMVYGNPKESPLFMTTDLYSRANSYAQYGSFAPGAEGNRLCWSHFFEQQLRVNVNYAEGDTLETIYHSPEVAAMPVYPAPGSTANVWGVTVMKISD